MKVVRDKISYYIGSFSCILNLFELLVNRTNKTLSFRNKCSLYIRKLMLKILLNFYWIIQIHSTE